MRLVAFLLSSTPGPQLGYFNLLLFLPFCLFTHSFFLATYAACAQVRRRAEYGGTG